MTQASLTFPPCCVHPATCQSGAFHKHSVTYVKHVPPCPTSQHQNTRAHSSHNIQGKCLSAPLSALLIRVVVGSFLVVAFETKTPLNQSITKHAQKLESGCR